MTIKHIPPYLLSFLLFLSLCVLDYLVYGREVPLTKWDNIFWFALNIIILVIILSIVYNTYKNNEMTIWKHILFGLTGLLLISLIFIDYKIMGVLTDTAANGKNILKDNIIALAGLNLAVLTAILGIFGIIYQLKSNNAWNQRHTALTQVRDRQKYDEALSVLNKRMNYLQQKKELSYIEEIRPLIFENHTEANNNTFTENGNEIRKSIIDVLNYYEYLAIGIKTNLFAEEVVKISLKAHLIKAYTVFYDYIKHMRAKNGKDVCKELEELVLEWNKEDKPRYKKWGATS